MPCMTIPFGDGVAFVRYSNPRRRKCAFCKRNWGTLLCDFEIAPGKTCDALICPACVTSVGKDRDVCPDHENAAPQGKLF